MVQKNQYRLKYWATRSHRSLIRLLRTALFALLPSLARSGALIHLLVRSLTPVLVEK